MKGDYYLHENGKLIYKPNGVNSQDAADSSFVKKVWCLEKFAKSPAQFLDFLHEAKTAGANTEEITRIAEVTKLATFIPNWQDQVFIS